MSKKQVFKAANAVFLDPGMVGSSVLYRMYAFKEPDSTETEYHAEVELRDCHKTITWGMWDDGDYDLDNMRVKIDRAISVLREARRQLENLADAVEKADGKRP